MKDKIELFAEVLASDPGSKLFYSLARLYAQAGQPDRAVDTLRQGLGRHPDHVAARLLLVDLLTETERKADAQAEAAAVTQLLAGHPGFWRLWAENLAPQAPAAALAVGLVGAHLEQRPVDLSQTLAAGLAAVLGEESLTPSLPPSRPMTPCPPAMPPASGPSVVGESPQQSPAKGTAEAGLEVLHAMAGAGHGTPLAALVDDEDVDAEADEVADEGSFRTRTMADLLLEQGDVAEALEIYQELLFVCRSPEERAVLEGRIAKAKGCLCGVATPGPAPAAEPEPAPVVSVAPEAPPSSSRVATLAALAERLEARAKSRTQDRTV